MAKTKNTFSVTDEARAELERWLRASNTKRSHSVRAQIVLLCADRVPVLRVAEKLGVNHRSVYMWRDRYAAEGLAGLMDRPRSGQPRKLSAEKAQEILRLTVKEIPRESTYWSLRLMARHAGVTPYQVRRIWQAADLKPHRLRTFKISKDPQFAEKVKDVVGLYLNPPDNAMVLSVDEKTQIQALDRTQPMLQLRPGQVERRTHDYKRHGTASLYAAFDIATGVVRGRVTKQHKAADFIEFLRQIERTSPKDLDLHLILDNSSTHKTAEVRAWLEERPRFRLHFTPTSASWLNAVEGWFAQLERRAVRRNSFSNVWELRQEIQRYIAVHNEQHAKPFRWTKSAEVILEKVEVAKRADTSPKKRVRRTNQTVH
jgi:transposase